ncbi:MAG: Fic family protein, partial [Deltaproteobacteria bacterium]|nr:Fic family protein [Deltaproteobacteria bacterium]
ENHLKQIHQVLSTYSKKDAHHRGAYKKFPNHVEAFDDDGRSLGIIFQTVTPFDTPLKMAELMEWFNREWEKGATHVLLLVAIFLVYFLAIHPFQDGNGRLSRIWTALLLLKCGYAYVPFASLERIIEDNKEQYYMALRRAQATLFMDHSTMNDWVLFFLRSLRKQISALESKIEAERLITPLSPLSQEIVKLVRQHGKGTVRDVLRVTGANRNTIKAHIKELVKTGRLEMMGKGKGAWYRLP